MRYQLFAPFGLAGEAPTYEMVGLTVSILTVSVSEVPLPATSVAEQLRLWVPSPVTEAVWFGAEPLTLSGVAPSRQLTLARPGPLSEAAIVSDTGSAAC